MCTVPERVKNLISLVVAGHRVRKSPFSSLQVKLEVRSLLPQETVTQEMVSFTLRRAFWNFEFSEYRAVVHREGDVQYIVYEHHQAM